MKTVNQPIRKKDALQLVTGQPVYTQDVAPKDCLVVKLLRSPHAHAIITEIDKRVAEMVEGIVGIYTYEDVDQNGPRFTLAGEAHPGTSPRDRLILDRHMRHVGDIAAIVAGENEKAVNKALSLINVNYEVLEPVLDMHEALDNKVVLHPEENWSTAIDMGGNNKRNLCAHDECGEGDIEKVLSECDIVIDRVYNTKATQQSMLETFRTFCTIDAHGRLNVVSSTQIVFHCRKIISNALGIPRSLIRVTKPRVGGGFGAKQTSISEVYPAFVTWKTKRPSMLIFSREETFIASSPRHEMEMHVRLGATNDGIIKAIDLYTLSNTGAYGEHGPTTVGLSGHKSIPLYGKADAFRFVSDVVYTNRMSSGAFRGYGATQGQFAVESAVNELAHKLNMNPMDLRLMNIVHEGDVMPAYFNQVNTSCTLDKCIERVREMIDWDNKYPAVKISDTKVRAVGMGISMQSSAIENIDVAGAEVRLDEGGHYTLLISAADMGTGCDTTLAQIAAEVLDCDIDMVTTAAPDTDSSPYDTGSYASSTAYLTGKAVEISARELNEKICTFAAGLLEIAPEDAILSGGSVTSKDGTKSISLFDVAGATTVGSETILSAKASRCSKISPPPFMAGAAEVEVDLETGEAKVINFAAAVDCGTPLNPNICRVQAEGGILQGIGMALTENITYDSTGHVLENSYMQYKIPTRLETGKIEVAFECSFEEEGPFGAKSIGEVVINTPLPSIADAIYNATGKRFTSLPITPERIIME